MGELAPPKGSLKRGGSLPLVGLGLGGAQPPLDPTQPVGTSFWNTSDAEFNKKVPLRDMDLFINNEEIFRLFYPKRIKSQNLEVRN